MAYMDGGNSNHRRRMSRVTRVMIYKSERVKFTLQFPLMCINFEFIFYSRHDKTTMPQVGHVRIIKKLKKNVFLLWRF